MNFILDINNNPPTPALLVLLFYHFPIEWWHWKTSDHFETILVHLSRRFIGELIVSFIRQPTVVRPSSTFSNIFSSEATRPKVKFYVQPPWVGGKKFLQTVMVTWTRRPSCPYIIHVKTFKNLLRWSWNLACSTGHSSATQFLQMMTLGWPLTFWRKCHIYSLMHLQGNFFQKVLKNKG